MLDASETMTADSNLSIAWAEMYLALAALISGFDSEPEDLVRVRDIDFVGDYFCRWCQGGQSWCRVKVRKVG